MSEQEKNSAENAENMQAQENNVDANVTPTEPNVESSEAPVEEDVMNKLLDQINELKDKQLRLQADFENYKKRTSKERLDLIQTANKETIVSMLEILDDADRAEAQLTSSEDIAQIKEGIQLVFSKLRKTMENKGVSALECKGKDFDVEQHEAITEVPMPGMEGKVIDEVQKGYFLNGKMIRFAKVVVGK
jgi:molecular chaperone GrpE